MTCLVCYKALTTDYQLVAIEPGTWRSLYACPGACEQVARSQAQQQKTLVSSEERRAA